MSKINVVGYGGGKQERERERERERNISGRDMKSWQRERTQRDREGERGIEREIIQLIPTASDLG